MTEPKPQSQYDQLMQQTNITYRTCEACHRTHVSSSLIEIDNMLSLTLKRVPPWAVCPECAEKISKAFSIWQKEKKV